MNKWKWLAILDLCVLGYGAARGDNIGLGIFGFSVWMLLILFYLDVIKPMNKAKKVKSEERK